MFRLKSYSACGYHHCGAFVWISLLWIVSHGSATMLFARAPVDEFVRRSGSNLLLGNRSFYAVGVNSYFLQDIASYGDTMHVREIFVEAQAMGVTTIRTWGFYDAGDSSNRSALQWGPAAYNERGLRALDLVVATAREYGIHLIIPFVNNWDDYGGMNTYVRWYANTHPSLSKLSVLKEQQYVYGAEGRRYALYAAGSLTHDDFYRIPEIKDWYKMYTSMIMQRVNTITGLAYKDDPTILLWELANEPRSSDRTGGIVYNWMSEMSAFIKSIDPNHLVATGEEGHDTDVSPYSSVDDYNNQSWLFDGTAGVSFSRNTLIPDIDVATVHCYPGSWGLTLNQGVRWFRDHRRISDAARKPVILEEVGKRSTSATFFEMLFSDILYGNSAGLLIWQFAYDNRTNNDGYAFHYPRDSVVCNMIARYTRLFMDKSNGVLARPASTSLLNSYPNPFNQLTVISYTLSEPSAVRLEIYNSLGQRIVSLVDEDELPGVHYALFEAGFYSSGAYFLVLNTRAEIEAKRIVMIK